MSQKNKGAQAKPDSLDLIITRFSHLHSRPLNRIIHCITIPVVTFGLLGMIWAIPFPHLDFLGRYNGFVNWASFIIAIGIYYYYRISPVTSYLILLMVFAFSAGIVGLEKLHNSGGWPDMWQVSLGFFVLGIVAQIAGHSGEVKKPSLADSLISLIYGPLWLFNLILTKVGVRR